jgi:hypothetical protein
VIKISIYFTSIFLHRYDHFEDLLTPEEEEEVMREKRIKEAANHIDWVSWNSMF